MSGSEDLEDTSMRHLPVRERLSITIKSDDIVLRLHTHRDHVRHNIHIVSRLIEYLYLRIARKSILREK